MTTPERDLAREDLFRFHWLLASGRGDSKAAQAIVRRWGLAGLSPLAMSEALEEAASLGVLPQESINRPLEGSE